MLNDSVSRRRFVRGVLGAAGSLPQENWTAITAVKPSDRYSCLIRRRMVTLGPWVGGRVATWFSGVSLMAVYIAGRIAAEE